MDFFSRLMGPPLPTLNASEVDEKLKSGKRPLLIDVRQPEEYQEGHIAGAKLIPLGELRHKLDKLPKEKEIICVCASGSRSHSATKMLLGAGYNVFNLGGGMFTWLRAGLPVKKGEAA